jgi:hypothetical protein
MKLVTDERCRLTSREMFKPNTAYDAEKRPDGRVTLTELVPAEVPVVRARKVNGGWVGTNIRLNRQVVAAAIRADRDA